MKIYTNQSILSVCQQYSMYFIFKFYSFKNYLVDISVIHWDIISIFLSSFYPKSFEYQPKI